MRFNVHSPLSVMSLFFVFWKIRFLFFVNSFGRFLFSVKYSNNKNYRDFLPRCDGSRVCHNHFLFYTNICRVFNLFFFLCIFIFYSFSGLCFEIVLFCFVWCYVSFVGINFGKCLYINIYCRLQFVADAAVPPLLLCLSFSFSLSFTRYVWKLCIKICMAYP